MRRCRAASTSCARCWASTRSPPCRRPPSTRTSRRCRSPRCLPTPRASGSRRTGRCAPSPKWQRRAEWARRSHTPDVTRCSPWSELPERTTSMRRTSADSRVKARQRRETAGWGKAQWGWCSRDARCLCEESQAMDAAQAAPGSRSVSRPARPTPGGALQPRLCGRGHRVGAACARSQEHPEGCRCCRHRGGVRVADGRAWRG